MERAVAVKKLVKLLGKSLGYRVDPKAPGREEREAARASLITANAERKRLSEQCDARRDALLAADAEYQSLLAARAASNKVAEDLRGTAYRYKVTVGTSNGMFFTVKAEGDSWEDVIEKITKKATA